MKIVHLACLHKSDDTRILIKECCSLARMGHDVVYYTSIYSKVNNKHVQKINNVKIKFHDLDLSGVVLNKRVFHGVIERKNNKKKLLQIMKDEKPDILHIHELELMYVMKTIKLCFPKTRIIYDVHEDNAEQYAPVLKNIFGNIIGNFLKKIVEKFDMHYVSKADGVITVTPFLYEKLLDYNSNLVEIRNMPFDIEETKNDIGDRAAIVCYCGGVTDERGISSLCSISRRVHGKILIAGPITESYLNKLKTQYSEIWGEKIIYLGYLDRVKVNELYSCAVVGLCILKYNKNIYHAFPIKLFEYMAAGIPVVCSDFPLWEGIVKEANCGICVNPEDEGEILNAINTLIDDRELAQKMALNGKAAIQNKYNWKIEEAKMIKFYQQFEYR